MIGDGRANCCAVRKEGISSFLKKSTKKLLLNWVTPGVPLGARRLPETNKSFLVLFFKKELLPYFLDSEPS
jgi:hypothetical protein